METRTAPTRAPGSTVARAAVWLVAALAALAVFDGGWTTIGARSGEELVGGVIGMVLLSCVPGVIYLRMIRTWRGTVLAGVGFVASWVALLVWIDGQSAESGMGGIWIVLTPVVVSLPVIAVGIWERSSWSGSAG